MRPLRLLVFDRTCTGSGRRPGLSDAWRAGKGLYGALGRLDGGRGVASWAEALAWLEQRSRDAGTPIGEVQFWGHGRRGRAMVDRESLDLGSLRPGASHFDALCKLRSRLLPAAGSSIWFRTCETLGGPAGHTFAPALADFLGARVAGHTHVIGFWQSGLHSLQPGALPHWPEDEGVLEDPASVAAGSSPLAPHTIQCLRGTIPAGW